MIMYIIKHIPEDFVVKEYFIPVFSPQGPYAIATLLKRDMTTIDAIEKIAKAVHVHPNNIGFAGNKDKRALTTQTISLLNASRRSIEEFTNKDISLQYLGQAAEQITLGAHKGNTFTIIVRSLTEETLERMGKNRTKRFVNTFGPQRYSLDNAKVGKHIIKKEFKEAVELLSKHPGRLEESIRQHIKQHPNDAIGALQTLPRRILMLYIVSYQSYLWNIFAAHFKNHSTNLSIPLVGFDTQLVNEEVKAFVLQVMEREGVSFRDFLIRQLTNMSIAGTTRSLFMEVKNFDISVPEKDETAVGRKKVKLEFYLGKGSYATELVRQVFGQDG